MFDTNEFAVIDVETANPDRSSICQIGVILCNKDGAILKKQKTFINPQDWFYPLFVEEIHKINEEMVKDAPTFAQWGERLNGYLDGRVVLQHSRFDMDAISRACYKHGVSIPKSTWLDNLAVARRAWPDMAKHKGGKGHSLPVLCGHFNYEYNPHDGLEDACAALHVFNEACKATGLDVFGWLERVRRPINLEKSSAGNLENQRKRSSEMKALCAFEPNQGPYLGEVLTFTGDVGTGESKMVRRDAILIAHELGFKVNKNLTKDNTVLVFGPQDMRRLAKGATESKKREKADKLIRNGQNIYLCSDADFLEGS